MNTLMRKVQHERLFGRLFRQPLGRMVGQFIRHVFSASDFTSVDVQKLARGLVRPLASEADPVIETRACRVTGSAHMPFADECCSVIGLLKPLRKGLFLFVHQ